MLTSRSRIGMTLVELLVALTIGGIALGLVASISLREQRLFADLGDASAVAAQIRDAAAILPIDLRAAATGAGDIREARDTSIELRGTIASAVVCDALAGSLVLAPVATGGGASTEPGVFAGLAAPIDVGDSVWIYSAADSVDEWRPYRVSSTAVVAAGQCAAAGPQLSAVDRARPRVGIALDNPPAVAALIGVPVRVTRPLRFSLYHASDGSWYLGERDWSSTNQRFNTIQPVSGPFLSPSSGGVVFRYADSNGVALPTPVADPRSIALIRIAIRGQTRTSMRALGAAGPGAPAKRTDTSTVAIFIRNRR